MRELALNFATRAHINQKRKYTNEPYIVHCIAVAKQLEELNFSEEVICAALLHDTVEDTDTSIEDIFHTFGTQIAKLVEELTDVYTSETYPYLNRRERKKMECERIAKISCEAKSIKLADLIDNSSSIAAHDKGFARIYLDEKEALLQILKDGDARLLAKANKVLHDSREMLK